MISWAELLVLLAILGVAYASTQGVHIGQLLLTLSGSLGLLLLLGFVGFFLFVYIVVRSDKGSEIARIEVPEIGAIEVEDLGIPLHASPRVGEPRTTKTLAAAASPTTQPRAPAKTPPAAAQPDQVAKPAEPPGPSGKIRVLKPATDPVASDDAISLEPPISLAPSVSLEPALRIDKQALAEIERQWRAAMLPVRLRYTGVAGFVVLGLLATVFGYLKADSLSGGNLRRRLQVVAASAILGIAALASFVASGRWSL